MVCERSQIQNTTKTESKLLPRGGGGENRVPFGVIKILWSLWCKMPNFVNILKILLNCIK
jgi:hypothetical protein